MSRGIAGLDKRDQNDVRRWLELEALARACVPPPRRLWPLWLPVAFAAGLACGRWLL